MKIYASLLICAVITLTGCAGAYPEKTVSFDAVTLIANLSPKRIEDVQKQIKEFDSSCRDFFHIESEKRASLELRIIAGASEYRDYVNAHYYDYAHSCARFGGNDGSFRIVMRARGRTLFADLRHVLTHYYVGVYWPDVAVWFTAGLAEYFEPEKIGEPNRADLRGVLQLFQRETETPLRLLFEKDTWERFHDRHVWQAWALVYYMIHGSKLNEARFGKLTDGLNEGKDFEGLLGELYMTDPEILERDLRSFISSLQGPVDFNFSIRYSHGYP